MPSVTVRAHSTSNVKENEGLFHKTVFFIVYGYLAVIFAIHVESYGKKLAIFTNPRFTDPSMIKEQDFLSASFYLEGPV